MNEMVTRGVRLKRIKAGHYETHDGRFCILLHPCSKNGLIPEWPHNEWLVYDNEDRDEDAVPVHSDVMFTLREAKQLLAQHIKHSEEVVKK